MIFGPNFWIFSARGDIVQVSDAIDAVKLGEGTADAGDDSGAGVQTRNTRTIGPEKLLELLLVVMSDVRELQRRI